MRRSGCSTRNKAGPSAEMPMRVTGLEPLKPLAVTPALALSYKLERLTEDTANMPVAGAIRKARVQAAIDFMSANLHRSISVNELARSAHLSGSHFARLFKAETGIAPGQYLTNLRMERAGQLLATTFLSIKEIMVAVGYKSRNNFIRFFRQHFHATPSEYRQREFKRP